MIKKHKVIFFGTPELSKYFLDALIKDANFDVVGVVTGLDKKTGRGQKLMSTPVAELASENNLKIFKPNKLTIICKKLSELQPEVAVLVAYGKIIPQEIIDIFPKGIINVHPSKLPNFRGPDPIREPLIQGLDRTGISIMKLDDKMDHGPILNKTEINITQNDNLGDLYEKVQKVGPDFLIKTLKLYLQDKIKLKAQNHKLATYTKLKKKQDAKINWNNKVIDIHNHIRAYNPKPGAFTIINNKNYKIISSEIKNNKIAIKQIKPEGKNILKWKDFLNGFRGELPQNMIDKIDKI